MQVWWQAIMLRKLCLDKDIYSYWLSCHRRMVSTHLHVGFKAEYLGIYISNVCDVMLICKYKFGKAKISVDNVYVLYISPLVSILSILLICSKCVTNDTDIISAILDSIILGYKHITWYQLDHKIQNLWNYHQKANHLPDNMYWKCF